MVYVLGMFNYKFLKKYSKKELEPVILVLKVSVLTGL